MILKINNVDTSTSNPAVFETKRQTFGAATSEQNYGDGPLEQFRRNMKNVGHLAKSLIVAKQPRKHFDADDVADRLAYAIFIKTGRWTKLFYVEWPALNVPATIEKKLVTRALSQELEQADAFIVGYN